MSDPSVLIIGTGLIGASVGCALTAAGHPVHLSDRQLSHARVAESRGAGTTAPVDPAAVGTVVVAVPPRALPEVIGRALTDYPAAAVTDVGSVKAGVLDAIWSHPERDRYVGSHPMAGSQHSGPVAARADLFRDRTWVITPHRKSAGWAVDAVTSLALACGARVVEMDVVDHDAAVARVSHLPHLLSALMAAHLTEVPAADLTLAGQGLRDVTRIAGSDPNLWEQIVTANSSAVLSELRSVRDRLDGVIAALEPASVPGSTTSERPELRAQLERGVEGTRRIPGKHGAPLVAYGEVTVEIPDAPGALGRLFHDIGAAGVNVEDVSIEHDQNRQVGYLSVAVAPDQVTGLVERMLGLGWDVQP